MEAPYSFDPEKLGADLARGIDAACRAFEDAWRAGQNPRIEDRLEDVAPQGRAALLVELMALECELLAERGRLPQPVDYLARFPGCAREVARAFEIRDQSSSRNQPALSAHEAETITSPPGTNLPPTEMPTEAAVRPPEPAEAATLVFSHIPGDDATSDFTTDALPISLAARLVGDSNKVRYFGDYLLSGNWHAAEWGSCTRRARSISIARLPSR